MKKLLKKIFNQFEVLGPVSNFIINRKYRRFYENYNAELKLYKQFGRMNLVFDIGANKGNKADVFSSLSKKVICVDPDEKNNEILNARFQFNKKISIECVALSDKVGEETFYLLEEGEQLNTLSEKWKQVIESPNNQRFDEARNFKKSIPVKTKTLDGLIAEFGKPDYVKIDVEGYELKVLNGLSTALPMISFESNLPEFIDETFECIAKLDSLSTTSVFNISREFKFLFDEWLHADAFKEKFKLTDLHSNTIEIYCKTVLM
ncbi:MAG: FkbM family methyltransferase [Chitinophagales bacterium]|nr:FkbM family methyltransferase [Chitinophagales bacterium]